MGMTAGEAVLGALVMVVGAAVQGAVGFGSNLIAAPLLVLIDPRFVPVPTILASLTLNVLVTSRERAPVVMRELRFGLVGFVPGAIVGAALHAVLDERTLGLTFAGFVLLAVALTASGLHLRPTPGTLLGAGFLSGVMGTASSIGGPPMAMLHSRSEGPVIRATLARFFLAAGLVSFTGLTLFGEVGWDDLRAAAGLAPGSLIGFALSGWGARWLDRGYTRPAILGLCFASAVAVAIKYLV
jgi:uncharacterized membrane protein YfcA